MAAKEYRPDEAFDLELIDMEGSPLFNDDGTPMTWSILGADSDIGVAARKTQGNLRLQQSARGKPPTQEAYDIDGANYLAKLTTGWNITPSKLVPGVDPGLGDGKVPFSTSAALTILKNQKLSCIREQPDRAITDRANFLKASPTS